MGLRSRLVPVVGFSVVLIAGACSSDTTAGTSPGAPCRLDGSTVSRTFGGTPVTRLEYESNERLWHLGSRYVVRYTPYLAPYGGQELRQMRGSGSVAMGGVGDEAYFSHDAAMGSRLQVRRRDFIVDLGVAAADPRSDPVMTAAAKAEPRLKHLARVVLCEAAP